MGRDYARIRSTIWTDPDFRALKAEVQRAYLLALSQPGINYCGVVPFTLRRWAAMAADTTERRLRSSLRVLETAHYVVVDDDTEELLVRSFLRHDGVLGQPNIAVAARKAFGTIHSGLLRGIVLCELHRLNAGLQAPGWEKGWTVMTDLLREPLPEGLPEGFLDAFGWGLPKGSRDALTRAALALPSTKPFPGVCEHGVEGVARCPLCRKAATG